jgi:D-glycerate 3-kinase
MTLAFDPRFQALFQRWLASRTPDDPLAIFGIAGAQGSGKSSLAAHLARELGFAHISLDDVYHTKASRFDLSLKVHPLFATRGQPLSHDLKLAHQTIDRLLVAGPSDQTPLPVFDKLSDDRRPRDEWPVFIGKPKAILVEGWCLGALPVAQSDLATPVNDFEARYDRDCTWRRAWAAELTGPYQTFFHRFDQILFLKAPHFECVLNWRCEQEAGLMGILPPDLPTARQHELARFVAQFERLTRHMIAGGTRATAIGELDEKRHLRSLVETNPPKVP